MARNIPAVLATCFALAACNDSHRDAPLDYGWAPPGACTFVGNRADRHYCATTGTQLLANPQVYDGQLVQVSGWVVPSPDGKDVGLFLTRDALDSAALHGSVQLNGPSKAGIAAYASKGAAASTPMLARVCGRFQLYNQATRFGAINEVDCGP